MFIAMRDRLEEEDGFTLIELLVVVIIIGILAAIAIPTFLRQRERGWQAAVESDLRNAAIEMETAATGAGGVYPGSLPATFRESANVIVSVDTSSNGQQFCLTAEHTNLTATTPDGVYDSDDGGLADNAVGCGATAP